MGGFGNQVMVDHGFVNGNSLMTSYNHLTRFAVGSGQYVTKGQLVGYSGNTGTSTACHLHFETYVNGDTVDPMTLIGS
ncbi:M23 family metallopeptidase, partial [Demequina sp.]|uniref:M23 family metallopeptidase n=1 Tax=Demequina sp. TaxID=2050685 RepID=UPI0025DD2E8E